MSSRNFVWMCATWMIGAALSAAPFASAQSREDATVRTAQAVLQETMANALTTIPASIIADSHGVAIIPNVLKGSFIVGARHGRGVLCVRDESGAWHAPVFITLTGGNVGWQVGVNASDIVLVFKTARSVQGLLSGKLTIGADAAAAAGPIGGQASAATDGRLQAEIYSYSRSRGLFVGVAIDGSVIRVDPIATGTYYGNSVPGQPVVVPVAAQQLTETIAAYAGGPAQLAARNAVANANPAGGITTPNGAVPSPNAAAPLRGNPASPEFVQRYSLNQADLIGAQLAQLAPGLFDLLDEQWKEYLGLPSQLFIDGGHPAPAELDAVVQRYSQVAADPRFKQLASRPEFQSVYGLLRHYQQSLSPSAGQLQLPPPPGNF